METEDLLGLRRSRRLPENQAAIVVLPDDQRVSVWIRDISLMGFGILSPLAIPRGTNISMEVSEEVGIVEYRCESVFCQQLTGDRFEIGLQVMDADREFLQFVTPNPLSPLPSPGSRSS
ncbi:MAG: hypothetical protein HQL57_05450 [Magnetococcales bacterium]|nr:hypothetical protein [Magnetococcales bacterium]